MDREYVGTLLMLATAAPALWVWQAHHQMVAIDGSARSWERECWRALWLSTSPVLLTAACVLGWWTTVSDDCPVPPRTILIASLLFAVVCGRAAWRAVRSIVAARHVETVATVGLWRPRVIVPRTIRRALDRPARRAALAHERAHARHRDPMRVWIAQLITDLQWPWPWARRRLTSWRLALEMARDEEARAAGVSGSDLAAAIIAVARLRHARGVAVPLGGDGDLALQHRIARLLAPVPAFEHGRVSRLVWFARLTLALLAIGSGLAFGRPLVWAAWQLLP